MLALTTSPLVSRAGGEGKTHQELGPGGPSALVDRIWRGVQQAQRHSSVCGSLTETRTSAILVRPLLLHATFCVQGTTGFRLSYTEPDDLTIIYRDRYVNVVNGRDKRTEAFEAGSGIGRAMEYFGSVEHLKRDFRVTAEETPSRYVLRMEPVAGRFKGRTGPIVATFDARDFRITRLEINGRNGVKSVFDIRIERVDVPLDPATFDLYRPGPPKERKR